MKKPAMLTDKITIGTKKVFATSLEDALAVVIAFGWQTKSGGPVSSTNPYKFAYHSYDCVLRGYQDRIVAGAYASTGLNSDVKAADLLNILAAHGDGLIPQLNDDVAFWDMDPAKLEKDPRDASPEGLLWAFYRAFMGVRVGGRKVGGIAGVGKAGYSKTAHWGWPRQMPLIDTYVTQYWDGDVFWVEMHHLLNGIPEWFDELERLLEVYRVRYQRRDGVPLGRIRALDILVWIHGRGLWETTLNAGQELLVGCPAVATW